MAGIRLKMAYNNSTTIMIKERLYMSKNHVVSEIERNSKYTGCDRIGFNGEMGCDRIGFSSVTSNVLKHWSNDRL